MPTYRVEIEKGFELREPEIVVADSYRQDGDLVYFWLAENGKSRAVFSVPFRRLISIRLMEEADAQQAR